MQESLMSQGIDLMLFGMGTVCVFLALLVVVTTVMSKLMTHYFPEPQPEALSLMKKARSQSARPAVDDRTLAIIQAAITQHRQK